MNVLVNVILAVQMLTALGMIGLILVQHGKGADMGAAFGSGSSGSLFGASGSANFLSRTTGVLAAVFFVARWRWPTLATRVPPVRAACWKRQPLWLPLRR
jgi:protein translocase SecG subunit